MNLSALMTKAKAIAALIVSLAGALILVLPDNSAVKVLGAVATALVTAGVVHQVPNAGAAPVQQVVDAITAAVPDDAALQVANAVNVTSRGVLKTATSPLGELAPGAGSEGG